MKRSGAGRLLAFVIDAAAPPPHCGAHGTKLRRTMYYVRVQCSSDYGHSSSVRVRCARLERPRSAETPPLRSFTADI